MTFVRRHPREVYRVYTEEEYLRGAELEPATGCEWPTAVASAGRSSGSLRLRRMAAVTMLVGATGTAGGAIVHNSSLFTSHRRAGGGSGHLLAATRSRAALPPVVVFSHAKPVRRVAARPRSSSSGKTPVGAPAEGGATNVTARTAAVRHVAAVKDLAAVKNAATIKDVRAVENTSATAGTATTESISVDRPEDATTAPSEPTSTTAPSPARKNQAEFGFER